MPAISASFSVISGTTTYDLLRKNSQHFEPSCFHSASRYPQSDYVEATQSLVNLPFRIDMIMFDAAASP